MAPRTPGPFRSGPGVDLLPGRDQPLRRGHQGQYLGAGPPPHRARERAGAHAEPGPFRRRPSLLRLVRRPGLLRRRRERNWHCARGGPRRGPWHTTPHARSSVFAATACVPPSSRYAVGGVTAHWNGQTWALGGAVATYGGRKGLAQGAQLQALSCPAPTECIGVGSLGTGAVGGARALADVVSATPAAQR